MISLETIGMSTAILLTLEAIYQPLQSPATKAVLKRVTATFPHLTFSTGQAALLLHMEPGLAGENAI